MGSQISRMSSLRATSKPNQDVESVKKYMDCIDVNEDDEESMATATLSKPHQKLTERTRKSASNFSFNTIHSPRETSTKKRRSKLRGQNLFADLIWLTRFHTFLLSLLHFGLGYCWSQNGPRGAIQPLGKHSVKQGDSNRSIQIWKIGLIW